jgi:hypothetical protein
VEQCQPLVTVVLHRLGQSVPGFVNGDVERVQAHVQVLDALLDLAGVRLGIGVGVVVGGGGVHQVPQASEQALA